MNKSDVLEQILTALRTDFATLQKAVEVAKESATNKENIAENKYDTLGLEASYLAHGQAKRALEIERALRSYEAIPAHMLQQPCQGVAISSLVELEDQNGARRWLWLGNEAGGLKFSFDGKEGIIVTPQSPLGGALMGREVGEIFDLRVADSLVEYEVVTLC
ncbi:MAG: GreA/GreB family elongation factor [Candidatus Polarisedimenticolaceae bacterium]|nr:GreA/GreB family elongation factor [Candidatus Polarisedimenticolaceae bacterium]